MEHIKTIDFPKPCEAWLKQYTLMMYNTVYVEHHNTLEGDCLLIIYINN